MRILRRYDDAENYYYSGDDVLAKVLIFEVEGRLGRMLTGQCEAESLQILESFQEHCGRGALMRSERRKMEDTEDKESGEKERERKGAREREREREKERERKS